MESADLLSLLEQSLEIVCLNSGTNLAMVKQDWRSTPFTLIGQSIEGPLWVEPEGEKGVLVPEGGGYILVEGTRYRLDPRDESPRIYHWGHFRLRVLAELDLFHFVASPHAVGTKLGAQIASLNLRLEKNAAAMKEPMIARIAQRRLLCAEVLSLIVSVSRPREVALRTGAMLARLAPVFRFMREQTARPILRDELADVAGLSPSRFHALFIEATGHSPLQYLTRLRLRQAQEMLLSTSRSIGEISESVGFRDLFHFSRTFKRFNGVSPRTYRERAPKSI